MFRYHGEATCILDHKKKFRAFTSKSLDKKMEKWLDHDHLHPEVTYSEYVEQVQDSKA